MAGRISLSRLLRRCRRASKRLAVRLFDRRPRIHFLHIGKNAGTQIHIIADRLNESGHAERIEVHPHEISLPDLPPNDPYFFSIRNPVTRFRSGFYSRKRKGRPHYNYNWTPDEKLAFNSFEHANDLAEALFSPGETGTKAARAMLSIQHVAMHQHHWFNHRGQFLTLRPPVHIIRQEHFDKDLAVFLQKIGASLEVAEKKSKGGRHKNDYADTPALSAVAISNLERWYAADFELYRDCETWIAENSP